jgi:hypothetical protein
MARMRIDCYLSPECGSEEVLRVNIARALEQERVHAESFFHRIDDERAAALRLTGSPSVLIDGRELQPLNAEGFS